MRCGKTTARPSCPRVRSVAFWLGFRRASVYILQARQRLTSGEIYMHAPPAGHRVFHQHKFSRRSRCNHLAFDGLVDLRS